MSEPTRSSERGAILILVAITIAVLVAMSAFVIDLGVRWMARGQAQNAADAGALAGALALEYGSTDLSGSGPAYQAAMGTAGGNGVFAASGIHVDLAADMTTWEHPGPPSCAAGGCVQVDVYADGTHGSSLLPTYFAQVFGITGQSIKATATAQVLAANTTPCLAPYFLIDRYTDVNGDMMFTSPPDIYVPAGPPNVGVTGYAETDIGTVVQFHDNLSPSGYGQLDVGSGTNAINDALNGCWHAPYTIGQPAGAEPGNKAGQKNGLDDLIASDPYAVWNATTQHIDGSCADTRSCSCPAAPGGICKYGGTISPRVMQVVVCAPTEPACALGGPSNSSVTGTNILSFFLTGYTFMSGMLTVDAVIIPSPAFGSSLGVPTGASFLKVVSLVR